MTVQHYDQPNSPWCTAAQVVQWDWFNTLTAGPLLDTLCLVASTWLWRATGRQFPGAATSTVRPMSRWLGMPTRGMSGLNGQSAANFFDSRGGRVGWPASSYLRGEWAFEVLLGHTPVRSVDQVVIEGQILDSANYRVDDARWLVRTDGQAWPYWQNWAHNSAYGAGGDQTSTWEVQLTWGEGPPPDGIYAAETLAGELALAATASSSCRLPNRVQSVARQGTSMLLVDPAMLLAGGKWGIPEIDMFVMSANPAGLQQPATMTSPDLPRAVRRMGTTSDLVTWQNGEAISWES